MYEIEDCCVEAKVWVEQIMKDPIKKIILDINALSLSEGLIVWISSKGKTLLDEYRVKKESLYPHYTHYLVKCDTKLRVATGFCARPFGLASCYFSHVNQSNSKRLNDILH